MKTASILFLFLATITLQIATAKTAAQSMKPEEEECVMELNLNRTTITYLNSKDIYPENNRNFSLFLSCYWRKTGWQEKNYEINYDELKAHLQKDIVRDLDTDNSAALKLLKKMVAAAVEECQFIFLECRVECKQREDMAVKVHNCVTRMFYQLMKEYEYLLDRVM